MSKKSLFVLAAGLALGVTGMLMAQQEYPNVDDPGVVLDNEHVVVQKIQFEAGEWVGEHEHAGNQMVVILEDIEIMYREGGEERTESRKAGEVYWVDAVTHDHKLLSGGAALLVTVK